MPSAFQRQRRERRERDQHLLAHREDPREWSIYADWLEREGDPRGELISLMLAREANPTEALAAAERKFFVDQPPWLFPPRALAGTWHSWWRGFLRSVDLLAHTNPSGDLASLSQHPSAQLLEYLAIAPSNRDRRESLKNAVMMPVRSLRVADSAEDSDPTREPIDFGPVLASPHLSHLILACTFDFSPTDWTRARTLTQLTLTHADASVVERIFKAPPPKLTELRLVSPAEPEEISDGFVSSQRWAALELIAFHECVLGGPAAQRLAAASRPRTVVIQARRPTDWDPVALRALTGVSGVVTQSLERFDQRFLVLDAPLDAEAGRTTRAATLCIAGRSLRVCELAEVGEAAEVVRRSRALRAVAFEVSSTKKECWATRFAGDQASPRRQGSENIWSLVQTELDAVLGFDPGAGVYSRLMQALIEAAPNKAAGRGFVQGVFGSAAASASKPPGGRSG